METAVTAHKRAESFTLDYWSRAFGALVAPGELRSTWPAGHVIGLEHEYRILAHGRVVDFRSVIHRLDLGRPRLDPADLNAYRLASGAALTADEAEAEIALAPISVRPGVGRLLAMTANAERLALATRLPEGARLEGYSTHLSVAVRPALSVAVAQMYASVFAAPLMLLMDRVSSPGLLVRPRASRLELGGEFVDGERLIVASVFVLGSVRVCQRWLEGSELGEIADSLHVELQQDDQRYGWFVSRTAFASDLYVSGRATELRDERGSLITAQAHLERCWSAARAVLVGELDESELELVDNVIEGTEPLPARATSVAETCPPCIGPGFEDDVARAFGMAATSHGRPGYDLAPVMLTWDCAVFVVSTKRRDRIAFASVPGPLLANFVSCLDQGDLDEVIEAYLALSPRGRRLDRQSATTTPGLYDDLAPRARLLVPERAPRSVGWTRRRVISGATRRQRSALRHRVGVTASGGHR